MLIDKSFLRQVDVAGLYVEFEGKGYTLVRAMPLEVFQGVSSQGEVVYLNYEQLEGAYPNEIAWERMIHYLKQCGYPLEGIWKIPSKTGLLPIIWQAYKNGDFMQKNVYFLHEKREGTFPYRYRLLQNLEKKVVNGQWIWKMIPLKLDDSICQQWGPNTEQEIFIGYP
jgi:hypothetical protein